MGTIIAVTNEKGGTGKSTTAGLLAAGLLLRGFKVLLIDADSQANATLGADLSKNDFIYSLTDIIKGRIDEKEAVVQSPIGFWVVPADESLSAVELNGFEIERFINPVRKLAEVADFTIIDTKPNMGMLTSAAISTADKIIIPASAEPYATDGLIKFMQLVNRAGAASKVLGILVTAFNKGRKGHVLTDEAIRGIFGDKVFKTVIRVNTAITDAQAYRKSLFDYAPNSNGAKDYTDFIDEVIERLG